MQPKRCSSPWSYDLFFNRFNLSTRHTLLTTIFNLFNRFPTIFSPFSRSSRSTQAPPSSPHSCLERCSSPTVSTTSLFPPSRPSSILGLSALSPPPFFWFHFDLSFGLGALTKLLHGPNELSWPIRQRSGPPLGHFLLVSDSSASPAAFFDTASSTSGGGTSRQLPHRHHVCQQRL